jgi:hypothetical protein
MIPVELKLVKEAWTACGYETEDMVDDIEIEE